MRYAAQKRPVPPVVGKWLLPPRERTYTEIQESRVAVQNSKIFSINLFDVTKLGPCVYSQHHNPNVKVIHIFLAQLTAVPLDLQISRPSPLEENETVASRPIARKLAALVFRPGDEARLDARRNTQRQEDQAVDDAQGKKPLIRSPYRGYPHDEVPDEREDALKPLERPCT